MLDIKVNISPDEAALLLRLSKLVSTLIAPSISGGIDTLGEVPHFFFSFYYIIYLSI